MLSPSSQRMDSSVRLKVSVQPLSGILMAWIRNGTQYGLDEAGMAAGLQQLPRQLHAASVIAMSVTLSPRIGNP